MTDAGPAYAKALGNPQGPHVLACDLVGTALARWFGLPTFDWAILVLGEDDEIPFPGGGRALPGPAFVTREETGLSWSGDAADLELIDNQDDVSRLVVLDHWLRNCDRHPPDLSARKPNIDNVFLSSEQASPGRFRLIAMDQGHCITCGRDLTVAVQNIDVVRDERVYGVFPAFRGLLRPAVLQESLAKLGTLPVTVAADAVQAIPLEWDVSTAVREALRTFVVDRASYLAGEAEAVIARIMAPAVAAPGGES